MTNFLVSHNLATIAEDVARALVTSSVRNGSAFVDTPLTYPSGAHVVIRMDSQGERWFVSDDGYASLEADMMGGLASFRRAARIVSEQTGVRFDNRCFFVLEVERESLPGAVTTVANASHQAVIRTLYAIEERRIAVSRNVFEQRLEKAFDARTVRRQILFVGQSGKEWEIDAGIEREGAIVSLFEFVTPRSSSVAAAVMKFSDIRALERPPHGAAVLSDLPKTDPHLVSLLSRVAGRAIPVSADEATYREAA